MNVRASMQKIWLLGPTCPHSVNERLLNLIMNEILFLREQADVYCDEGGRKMKMGCSMGGRGWRGDGRRKRRDRVGKR